MRRCDHTNDTVEALDFAGDYSYQITFESDCEPDGCSYIVELPPGFEGWHYDEDTDTYIVLRAGEAL